MRWLQERPSDDELERMKTLLEGNGIPLYVAHSPFGLEQGVFVCLEEQYEDALALLRNPNHKVANPVNVEQFHRILKRAERRSPVSTVTLVSLVFAILLAILLIVSRLHA